MAFKRSAFDPAYLHRVERLLKIRGPGRPGPLIGQKPFSFSPRDRRAARAMKGRSIRDALFHAPELRLTVRRSFPYNREATLYS